MKKQSIFIILSLLFVILTFKIDPYLDKMMQDDTTVVPEIKTPQKPPEDFTDKVYIAKLVNEYADYYGVDRKAMQLVVANESKYVYNQHTKNDGRTGCHANGLIQLNTCYLGKGISIKDANNPHFALDLLARKIASGDGRLWTAFKTCVNKEVIYYQGKQVKCDTSKVITV